MKIACISDTHGQHHQLTDIIKELDVDVLIHSGDGSNYRDPARNSTELVDFLMWMQGFLHIKHKIFVPGNHDTSMFYRLVRPKDFDTIDVLINEEIVLDGIKFYGSPMTPTFGIGWAWNINRAKIYKYWDAIPEDTDVLITHGPPWGVNDLTIDYGRKYENTGCKNLLKRVFKIQPTYHIFGHLHDEPDIYNHGIKSLGDKCKTTFVNASICDIRHEALNKPILIEI